MGDRVAVAATRIKSFGYDRQMLAGSPVTVGLLTVALLAVPMVACVEPPPSFRLVGLDEARALLHDADAVLVEAYAQEQGRRSRVPGSVPWPLITDEPPVAPSLPPGPVLLLAPTQEIGYRAAAALARARNGTVFVIITDRADERGTLYALDPLQEEIPRGRDS